MTDRDYQLRNRAWAVCALLSAVIWWLVIKRLAT